MRTCKNLLFIIAFLILQLLNGHKALAIGERCRIQSRNQLGTCKDIKQCDELRELLLTQGQAAGEFLRSTTCYYSSTPIVCCPDDNDNNNSNQLIRPNSTPAPRRTKTRTRTRTTTTTTTISSNTTPKSQRKLKSNYWPIYAPDCGKSNGDFNRIVGGQEAQVGAWPWIAALGYWNDIKRSIDWKCGGSLISKRHILTAAHCVYNRTEQLRVVRLGEHNLYNDNDGANPIDVSIELITIHPNYVPFENDIALIKLDKDIEFSDNIHPICLPLTQNLKSRNLDRTTPFVAGWGIINTFKTERGSSVLREVQVTVASEESCKEAFKSKEKAKIDERVLCAGSNEGGKGVCSGDSGGSLMSPDRSIFYAVGVVSLGIPCGQAKYPDVYTKVTQFLDFILSNMN